MNPRLLSRRILIAIITMAFLLLHAPQTVAGPIGPANMCEGYAHPPSIHDDENGRQEAILCPANGDTSCNATAVYAEARSLSTGLLVAQATLSPSEATVIEQGSASAEADAAELNPLRIGGYTVIAEGVSTDCSAHREPFDVYSIAEGRAAVERLSITGPGLSIKLDTLTTHGMIEDHNEACAASFQDSRIATGSVTPPGLGISATRAPNTVITAGGATIVINEQSVITADGLGRCTHNTAALHVTITLPVSLVRVEIYVAWVAVATGVIGSPGCDPNDPNCNPCPPEDPNCNPCPPGDPNCEPCPPEDPHCMCPPEDPHCPPAP